MRLCKSLQGEDFFWLEYKNKNIVVSYDVCLAALSSDYDGGMRCFAGRP